MSSDGETVATRVQALVEDYRDFAAAILLALLGAEMTEDNLAQLEEERGGEIDETLAEIWPWDESIIGAEPDRAAIADLDAQIESNEAAFNARVDTLQGYVKYAREKREKLMKKLAKKLAKYSDESESSDESADDADDADDVESEAVEPEDVKAQTSRMGDGEGEEENDHAAQETERESNDDGDDGDDADDGDDDDDGNDEDDGDDGEDDSEDDEDDDGDDSDDEGNETPKPQTRTRFSLPFGRRPTAQLRKTRI